MDINKSLTTKELEVLYHVAEDYDLTGASNIRCPRCHGKLIFERVSTSYSIECENDCGIKMTVRGI
jgi:hypothetical protein